ncbi:MAG: diaminopimelate epimerase [Candidatus Aminicenantes bacterium]|nr:diaminopimelate epimerase [Candidatus Aminicenantes bacterium]
MKVKFTKLQGCGNDFILIDEDINPDLTEEDRKKLSTFLRDRHFSVGADSLLYVSRDGENVSYRTMEDGIDLDMCGTGVRCAAHYYHQKEEKTSLNIITIGKAILGVKKEGNFYRVNLGKLQPAQKYTTGYKGPELIVKSDKLFTSDLIKSTKNLGIDLKRGYFLNPSEAHLVFFVDDVADTDLKKVGELFAFNREVFPESTNVSVGMLVDAASIHIRTYERASFNETLACGTGSVASACAAKMEFGLKSARIRVISKGGEQFVLFDGDNLFLLGPAETVFTGEIEITG